MNLNIETADQLIEDSRDAITEANFRLRGIAGLLADFNPECVIEDASALRGVGDLLKDLSNTFDEARNKIDEASTRLFHAKREIA